MKCLPIASKFLGIICALASIFGAYHRANAIDESGTVFLDRYSILDDYHVQHDTGQLLKNGSFSVLATEVVDTYGDSFEWAPIDGRPTMSAEIYDEYHALGLLPTWVRSRDTFTINFFTMVIVAVKGKGDPNPTPVIHSQPESQDVLLGGTAFFSIDAGPEGSLTYQWQYKKKDIPGEDSPFLFVSNVDRTNAGIYTVLLNTGGKDVSSARALLRLIIPASIKKDPKSQAVKTGKTAVLRVSASGTGPLTYQWYVNGSLIPGATKSFYTLKNVQPEQAGAYTVKVSNGLSDATSAEAALTVGP